MRSELQTKSWIFGRRPQPQAHFRLFCFPNPGGGASSYRPWTSGLAPEIEVCPVQLPGHENRMMERPFQRFDVLVEALADALLPSFDLPFAFFGHSMGALLSFGLAQYLHHRGDPMPVHLFLSAYRSPQIPDGEILSTLPDNELTRKVQELNGPSPEVLENAELRRVFLPILRADCAICETYVSTTNELLNIPITVFGGMEDHRVTASALALWREQTCGIFEQHILPGGHFFWHHDPSFVWQIIRSSLMS